MYESEDRSEDGSRYGGRRVCLVLVVLNGKGRDEADLKNSEAHGQCAKGQDYTTEIVMKHSHRKVL